MTTVIVRSGIALAIALSVYAADAQTVAAKPRMPPGVDPGGIAIALITTGIDYTRPDVARCLARDGEGELIGWDVVDRDRWPYKAGPTAPTPDDLLFSAVECRGDVRIVPVRVDPADPGSLARAIAFVATTPARVVVVPTSSQPRDWAPLRAAAAKFDTVLIVLAAPLDGALGAARETAARPNVALVAAGATDGDLASSHLAVARATMLVVCAAITRNSAGGAALKATLLEQMARVPSLTPQEILARRCL